MANQECLSDRLAQIVCRRKRSLPARVGTTDAGRLSPDEARLLGLLIEVPSLAVHGDLYRRLLPQMGYPGRGDRASELWSVWYLFDGC